MKKDKLKIYVLELFLILFLFFTLFASNINTRWLITVFLVIFMFIVKYLIKKRGIKSVYDKQVLILMLVFSLIYLGVYYALGLHYGFVRSKYYFGPSVINIIIPTIIIIVTSEIIRNILLSQDGTINIRGHKVNISVFLVYVALVLIDYILYAGIYNLYNINDFLSAIGFVLFASMSNNLLFNYISKRYGKKSIILFRLITVLYIYIIPYQPDVYLFLRTFLRMLYPFVIYLVLEKTYAKSSFAVSFKDKKKNILWTLVLLVVVTLMIMLISCQFKYGIVVVGSESMTGTIDKGDAIIYERFDDNERIKKGQVIIFQYNGIRTIHRIVEIKNINGVIRYYTKGDANKDYDAEYRTIDDIDGLVKVKIKYIGRPTLWLRSLFD